MRQSITTRRLTKVMLALPIFLTDANNENKVKVLRFVTSPDDQDIDHQDNEGRDGQECGQFNAHNKVDFLRRQMQTQGIYSIVVEIGGNGQSGSKSVCLCVCLSQFSISLL